MSEDLLIKHCSPTLAGIKTGNLFSCTYTTIEETEKAVRKYNNLFIPRGVKIQPLKYDKGRVLIYVYRPSKLEKDLSDEFAIKLLQQQGYKTFTPESCILNLILRINSQTEFPHEIGLFLGYPPEDVHGFILHKGNGCKLTGCWKVYGDEGEAEKLFARFRKCSDIYYSKWKEGTSISRLTVAV